VISVVQPGVLNFAAQASYLIAVAEAAVAAFVDAIGVGDLGLLPIGHDDPLVGAADGV